MTLDEVMNLINRSLFATMGYTDEQERQNVRRVFCVWHKGLGRHLISTNTSSRHVQTLINKPDMCLYFSDDSSFEGLCLYGKAVIHMDREYKELLWNEGDEKYYPKGIDDEDYCVLEFVADSGRFYRYDGKGDISKEEIEQYDVNKVFEANKIDRCIHLAALAHTKGVADTSWEAFKKVNVDCAVNLFEVCEKQNVPVLFISTVDAIGMVKGVITPDTKLNPISNYGKN